MKKQLVLSALILSLSFAYVTFALEKETDELYVNKLINLAKHNGIEPSLRYRTQQEALKSVYHGNHKDLSELAGSTFIVASLAALAITFEPFFHANSNNSLTAASANAMSTITISMCSAISCKMINRFYNVEIKNKTEIDKLNNKIKQSILQQFRDFNEAIITSKNGTNGKVLTKEEETKLLNEKETSKNIKLAIIRKQSCQKYCLELEEKLNNTPDLIDPRSVVWQD